MSIVQDGNQRLQSFQSSAEEIKKNIDAIKFYLNTPGAMDWKSISESYERIKIELNFINTIMYGTASSQLVHVAFQPESVNIPRDLPYFLNIKYSEEWDVNPIGMNESAIAEEIEKRTKWSQVLLQTLSGMD